MLREQSGIVLTGWESGIQRVNAISIIINHSNTSIHVWNAIVHDISVQC